MEWSHFSMLLVSTLLQSESVTRMHTRQKYMHFNPMEYYSAINHLLLWLSFSVKRSFPFLLPRLMCQQYTAITIAETRCRREGGERDQTKTIKTKAKAKEKKPQYMVWCMCSDGHFIYTTENTWFWRPITHCCIKEKEASWQHLLQHGARKRTIKKTQTLLWKSQLKKNSI